jgi:hypothetical protein
MIGRESPFPALHYQLSIIDSGPCEGEQIVSRVVLGVLIGLVLGVAGAVILVKYPEVREFLKLPEAANEKEGAPKRDASRLGSQADQEPAEESFVEHGAGGQTLIKLDPNEQTRIGLKVALLQAAQVPSEVKGFGRVVDSTPLVALVAEGATAQASFQASTKEYERVKTLYSQGQNASAKALETAEAALNKDQVAVESVRLRLLAGWGQEIASRPDLPAFVTSLAARQAALIRVDVPLGDRPKAPPVGGRVAPVGAPESIIEAQMIGPAPTTDLQAQTEGYLLLAKTSTLASGAALVAWLALPGEPRSGVIVPRNAVLRHEGTTFVYLQTDETFQRKAVALERPLGDGWFVAVGANDHSPLQPQAKVVVVGAQELLSEELKGQGGEE